MNNAIEKLIVKYEARLIELKELMAKMREENSSIYETEYEVASAQKAEVQQILNELRNL